MDDFSASRIEEPSDTIWDWRAQDLYLPEGGLLSGVVLQCGIVGAIACLMAWKGHLLLAQILGAVAVAILLAGLFFRKTFDRFSTSMRHAGFKLGEGISVLLLIPVFFLLFIPMSIWFRISGKDPLKKAFPCRASSCWLDRPPGPTDQERYKRQF